MDDIGWWKGQDGTGTVAPAPSTVAVINDAEYEVVFWGSDCDEGNTTPGSIYCDSCGEKADPLFRLVRKP